MESNSEAADDQGSGWFEVKKKHRSSSKYSIRGLVGGFSNRRSSSSPRNQSSASERTGNLHAKQGYKPSKVGQEYARAAEASGEKAVDCLEECIVNPAGEHPKSPSCRSEITANSNGKTGNIQEITQKERAAKVSGCSSVSEVEKAIDCLEICIVNQAGELPKSPSCRSELTIDPNGKTGDIQEIMQKEKLDVVSKIKWGNLEDEALILCCENLDKAEIKFGNIGDDNLVVHKLSGDADDLVSCDPSCIASQEDKAVVISLDSEHVHSGMPSSAVSDKAFAENREGINDMSSNDVGLLVVDEEVVGPNDAGCSEEILYEHILPTGSDAPEGLTSNNLVGENGLSSSANEVAMIMTTKGPEDKFEDGCLEVSEITANRVSGVVICDRDSVLPPLVKISSEASDNVPVAAAVEDLNESHDDIVNVDIPKVQLMNHLGEGELGESKERFRERLWCFLFENLSRAVDELYLLCELECDLEQMNEAILVLEEAGSDFRELKSRVQGFEKVKKSSSQPSVDGSPVNVKTDHRRPHSLSWEVRRMTSSPHRAEILSSSLEAFKKIQNERASMNTVQNAESLGPVTETHNGCNNLLRKSVGRDNVTQNVIESVTKSRKKTRVSDVGQGNLSGEKRSMDGGKTRKVSMGQNNHHPPRSSFISGPSTSQVSLRDNSVAGKCSGEPLGSASDFMKQVPKKDKVSTDSKAEKNLKCMDPPRRQIPLPDREKEKEKRNTASWKSMDAWKEKRNWEDILASPLRVSSRVSYSPGMSRKSVERARVLHDKLMSPDKKKRTAVDLKKEAEEKHARAMRIRNDLENERVQRLHRTSEKLIRVNEWQAVRTMKLREGMHARHQRGESRHEAYLAQVVRRAGDESSKVNEVRFITSLNEENKKLILRQKLQDSELRRAEKLQIIKSKQKEDIVREEAVLGRRRILQAEKLQRLAEIQRRKEEAQIRREEELKASSAAREARAVEQLRRKEVRAKAQQEEAELLAQKLAERLSESEQRRKFYLEQIRERASMDFRDQSSPLLRRSLNKESLGRSSSTSNVEDYQANSISCVGGSVLGTGSTAMQHSLKRRTKKIRQRLMALKYEFPEPPVGTESTGIGYRAQVGTARAKIGRWLQELQRLRQARKEGAASIGIIVGDMIKFLEGKEPELNASRQAGLLDFIASALPASHTSKPEACLVTIYLLRLLRVVLSVAANRSYFLAQNLLPPIIPVLSAALENYIKIAASLNVPGSTNSLLSKTSPENFKSVSEVLEGFLWTVTTIIGHICFDEKQCQMQDGLLELVIAYQVIHRLRDLFALYDRPQVEGSPFPSSIILSLNLLAVLTSKPRTISSIDWDSFPSKAVSAKETQESKLADLVDLGHSSLNGTTGDNRSPLSVLDAIAEQPLSGVPGERPLDGSHKASKRKESPSSDGDLEKELTDASIKLNLVSSALMHEADAPGESRKSPFEGHSKPLSQKDEKSTTDIGVQKSENIQSTKKPVAFLLSVIAETGLISLPSLLTAVLLQANNRLSSEQASYVLPSNFEEVSTGVLMVLNNLALLDINLMQRMLARPDLKMEFFHLMSFLLSHCTIKWKTASDQVGLLLLESLLLLGYFALFHPGNQAVLRWGKSPTILHKVCDLPFVFFSDPELMPILAGTLVATCYGCEQNRDVVQQELSTDMLLSLLKSCKNGLLVLQSYPTGPENPTVDDACEVNQSGSEPKKFQCELPTRSNRYSSRNTRLSAGKVGTMGSSTRIGKLRNQRDNKATKTCEEWALKHNLPASETSSSFMLHSRFPSSFVDRAEEFFSADVPTV